MASFAIMEEKLREGAVLLTLKGFLDAHTYEELENKVNALFGTKVYKLVFDLTGLDYISSAGAGVFIGAIGTAQENDGNIVLVSPTSNVKDVFDLLGLSQIFTFAENKESALRALAK